MSNEIKVFENEEFGKVRTVVIDDEPWFVGKDVCLIFGDKNHNRSLGRIDPSDKRAIDILDSKNRTQSPTFVNESGLYSLLFSMQPQKANNDGVSDAYPIEVQERIDKLHKFKRWVTAEVLPSIRKTGSYSIQSKQDNEEDVIILKIAKAETIEERLIAINDYHNIIVRPLKEENKQLITTNEVLVEDILSWADRNLINAVVRRYGSFNGNFGSAWIEWKKELLYKYSINVNARMTAHRNSSGKKTKPKTLDMIYNDEVPDALRTAVSMCESKGIDVSDLLVKHKENNT